MEEDNIDPLVVPPLLAQPTPSLYYPPSLRLRSDVCAHLRPLKTHGCPGHARVLSFLKRDLNEKGEKHRGESYVLHIFRVLSSADYPLCLPREHSPPPLFRYSTSFRIREWGSRWSVAVATLDSWQVPKTLRGPARARGATSLKINSVKEPTDIRGLREDFTPQTLASLFSRAISLSRAPRLSLTYVRPSIIRGALISIATRSFSRCLSSIQPKTNFRSTFNFLNIEETTNSHFCVE